MFGKPRQVAPGDAVAKDEGGGGGEGVKSSQGGGWGARWLAPELCVVEERAQGRQTTVAIQFEVQAEAVLRSGHSVGELA